MSNRTPLPTSQPASPVVYLALSTWLLAVSSVHVSMLLFSRDLLAIPFLQGPYLSVDGWSLVHVLFYFAVAVSYPGRFWWMMGLGVAWEFAEAWFAGLGKGAGTVMGQVWEERGVNSL